MSFGAAPEYGRSSQSPIRPNLSSRLHRVGAPSARHRHSQDLTDDGGRPPVSSAPSAKEGVSVCRHPLHARLLESSQASCRVVRRASSLALRDDECTGAKNSDTSHGVRCLSTKSASRIVGAPTCLTGAIRSQGFSPSQRLHPLETSWLCFTPHPSPGFRASRAFPTQPAAAPLGAQCSPAVQVSPLRRAETRSEYEELRLQSLTPAEHSSPA